VATCGFQFEPILDRSELVLSVSKRLAPAAPLRNMIRRVLRESWRHQTWVGQSRSLAVMIRLRSLPLPTLPTGSIESGETNVRLKLPKGRAVLRLRRTDRALKTIIRKEADSLLQGLGRSIGLAKPTR
jgi:RNase P protein component